MMHVISGDKHTKLQQQVITNKINVNKTKIICAKYYPSQLIMKY